MHIVHRLRLPPVQKLLLLLLRLLLLLQLLLLLLLLLLPVRQLLQRLLLSVLLFFIIIIRLHFHELIRWRPPVGERVELRRCHGRRLYIRPCTAGCCTATGGVLLTRR